MRMHANHADYPKYSAYLDGVEIWPYWVADEEEGFIEVYETTGKLRKFNSEQVKLLTCPIAHCKIDKETGKIVPNNWHNPTEDAIAPWFGENPRVKLYGKVEIRRLK